MTAIREPGDEWQYRIKLSEEPIKISNPGLLQIAVSRILKDNFLAI
ncbi:hypothetical protein BGP_6385 [Beggiatoa sp. PS]|nr:hypothetical protein BGP_6385 [Beggiatoa sp. PS]